MRFSIAVLVVAFLVAGCGQGSDRTDTLSGDAEDIANAAETPEHADGAATADEVSTRDLLNRTDPAGSYGEALARSDAVSIAAIHENPVRFEGKVVRVKGTVTRVCPMRGCWMDLAEEASGSSIRVKVDDGVIVFPLSARGREALVEGTVERIELTEEEARSWRRHEAAELGETFDPESVTGPQTIWRIKGRGAEIRG